MIRKIENAIAVFFVLLLTISALVIKLFQEGLFIPVFGSEIFLVNLVFLFSCVSGVITWRSDRHISLASLTDRLPMRIQAVVAPIRSAAVCASLVALFFTAFTGNLYAFSPNDYIWGIPIRVIFAVYPLMFFSMLAMVCSQKKNVIACMIGCGIGLLVSPGSIIGILFFFFELGEQQLPFLYSLNSAWLAFSSVAVGHLVVLMVVFALLGVPLFIVISAIAYLAFSAAGGYVDVIPLEAYRILTDKNNAAIPLFTIAGYLLSTGSAGTRLIDFFKSVFGWFRGGTVIAAVLVVTFFTTFTGVSGITILALGSLLTTVLVGSGYQKENAQSLITSSGAIGLLFPPSVAIIMYGSINYFSVDVFDIFRGAIIPGLMLAVSMVFMGILRDKQSSRPKFSAQDILNALKTGSLELLMPFVLICLYFFFGFTLMQVAAAAVLYAFVLETFIRKDYSVSTAFTHLAAGVAIAGGVLAIMGAAGGLSYYLLDANIPRQAADFMQQFISSKYVFLLLLNIFLLIIGCLMDIYSAIMVVSPVVMVIAEAYGISAVHVSVVFLMNMQIGFLTPPVGMDLFIASYAFNTPVMQVARKVVPFLLIQLVVLLLVTYIPWFTQALF